MSSSPHNAHHAPAVRHARHQPSHGKLHEQRAGHAQRAQLESVGTPAGERGRAGGWEVSGAINAVGRSCRKVSQAVLKIGVATAGWVCPAASMQFQCNQAGAPVPAGDAAYDGGDLQLAKSLQPKGIPSGSVQHKSGKGRDEGDGVVGAALCAWQT